MTEAESDTLLAAIQLGREAGRGSGRPERVLRDHVQPALASALSQRGVRSAAKDEFTLSVPSEAEAGNLDAPVTSYGRADAIYNRFVIEFEPPGSLRPSVAHSATRHAVGQVQQYLRGIQHESGIPLERLAGCAFDGTWIVYVIWDRSDWSVSAPRRVDRDSLQALVDTLESLATGRGLTAANLDEDFGRASAVAGLAVRTLAGLFISGKVSARGSAMFNQWMLDISNAAGPFSATDLAEWASLCEALGVPSDEASSTYVLFSLQTYFALVAKLVALVVLEGATKIKLVEALASTDPVQLAFQRLESGELTISTNAINAIEPGVFSWYVGERSKTLDECLKAMVDISKEYSAEIVEITPLAARDVLKDLYQRLLPGSIRHRLGEYYTPDWLAQRLINQVTGSDTDLKLETRVLDPACGSGTFLVEVISRMLATATKLEPAIVLRAILQNVVGFDLSPLAVQASKVNYLLALAPLLRHAKDPVFLPVFLADSVSLPRRGGLLDGDVYVLETSQGDWRVPVPLAHADHLPVLGAILQKAVSEKRGVAWVSAELKVRFPIIERDGGAMLGAGVKLFEKLRDLQAADRDGMWWPLITNAFAPGLLARFDFVVGNPPWVSWETLPEAYRRATDEEWLRYRLRPDIPPERRQASAQVRLDLAMLFVARAMDRYLVANGRLGFVITASVFQSELAGRGFRRRHLPPSSSYRFVHIDDLSTLHCFEEASNRTSILIADRQRSSGGSPIPVTRWLAPPGRRTIPKSIQLKQVAESTVRQNLYAEPVDPSDDASPLLIMRAEGLKASRPLRKRSHYLSSVREGVNTRGANGVFFVEVLDRQGGLLKIRNLPGEGRGALSQIEGTVEFDSVKQLLRGSDVERGAIHPEIGLLFFHDDTHLSLPFSPAQAEKRFPLAFRYLKQFEGALRGRHSFRNFDPSGEYWLGLYSVTSACVARHKVVFREIAQGMIGAAIHSPDIIPDHKLHVIPTASGKEADHLAEVLNSRVVDFMIRSFALSTSIGGSFLRYIGITDLSKLADSPRLETRLAGALGLDLDEFNALNAIAQKELSVLERLVARPTRDEPPGSA